MSCKADTCKCTFQTTEEVRQVLQKVEDFLHKESLDYYAFLKFGYNLSNGFLTADNKLSLYHRTLKRHYYSLVSCGRSTLKCKQVSSLIKSINRVMDTKVVKKQFSTLEVDDSGLNTWIALNPNCVPMERWESCICAMVPQYKLNVTNFKELCEIIVDIQKSVVNCDINAPITLTYKDCNIEATLAKELIDCGLDVPLINKAIDCGLTFKYIDGEIGIVGVNGVKISFKDITDMDTSCLT